jgi:tetratricopeptide (TPR) repeat protein
MGTPSYMAPEQAMGKVEEIGPLTDVWALGAILYEVLTGRPPFRGATAYDTIDLVCNADPVAPRQLQPKLPRDLETICLKCLEKDSKKRYPSAYELAEDLNRFLQGEPIHARPIRTWEKGLRWVRRHPSLSAVGAGVTLVIITASVAGVYIKIQQDEAKITEANQKAELLRVESENEKKTQGELTKKRDAIRELINSGDQAVNRTDWKVAQTQFMAAMNQAKQDTTNLSDQYQQAERRYKQVQEKTDALAERDRFHTLENEALFQALGPTALGRRARQKAIRDKITEALRVVKVSPDAPAALDVSSGYTPEARDEVAQGCYQLLALLAESMTQPLPGETTEEYQARVKDALRILDRAGKLTADTPKVRSYLLRRASCLEALQRSDEAEALRQAGQPAAQQFVQKATRQRDQAQAERELAAKLEPKAGVDLFLLGEQLFQEGDPDSAANWFETALSNQSKFWPRYLLAQCYMQQAGESSQAVQRLALFDRAREQLDTCLNSQPPEAARVWILLLRGFVYANMASYDSANKDFDAALGILKDKPDAAAKYALLNNRGIMQVERNDYPSAIKDLQEAIQEQPKQFQAFLSLAKVYDEQAQRAKQEADQQADLAKRAESVADRQAAEAKRVKFEADREAALAKAEVEFGRALGAATQLVKDRELDATVLALLHRNVGAFHQQHKQRELALKDFEQAVAVARQNVPAGKRLPDDPAELEALARGYFDCGRVYQTQNHYPEAVRAFDQAIEALHDLDQGPALLQRWGVYRWRGDAQMQVPDYEGAVASYDHYLKRGFFRYPIGAFFALGSGGPLHAVLLLNIKQQYRVGGRAVAGIFRARGFARQRLNQFEAAVEDYGYALELEPEDWASYDQRGRCFLVLGSYSLAERDFHRAIGLHADEPDLYTGRGFARVKLGRVTEAVTDTDEALRKAREKDAAAKKDADGKSPTSHVTPILLYQAARVYAQATAQPRERVTAEQRRTYEKLGLTMVQKAVEANPPEKQPKFWQDVISTDRELEPLHKSEQYARMDTDYSRTPAQQAQEAENAVSASGHKRDALLDAARVYARAGYKLFMLASRGDNRAASREYPQYERRALQLLGEAVEKTGAGQRPAFWRNMVEVDHAFDNLRTQREYGALAEKCRNLSENQAPK